MYIPPKFCSYSDAPLYCLYNSAAGYKRTYYLGVTNCRYGLFPEIFAAKSAGIKANLASENNKHSVHGEDQSSILLMPKTDGLRSFHPGLLYSMIPPTSTLSFRYYCVKNKRKIYLFILLRFILVSD